MVQTRNDPMCHEDTGEELQREWRPLAAGPHALPGQVWVEQKEGSHENRAEDRQIDPVARNCRGTGRREQGDDRNGEKAN